MIAPVSYTHLDVYKRQIQILIRLINLLNKVLVLNFFNGSFVHLLAPLFLYTPVKWGSKAQSLDFTAFWLFPP